MVYILRQGFSEGNKEAFRPCTFYSIKNGRYSNIGKNDNEHFRNLESVLDIAKKSNLQLKKTKCIFMASEATYLGFRINKNGVNPLPEKVTDLLKAETPKNTTQLKSFLGMLNYYHRHLPNLAHILEPLHQVLRKNSK